MIGGWRGWLIAGAAGAAGTITLAAAFGLLVIYSGAFNTTADTPHEPAIAWVTHNTMIHSVRARAKDISAPARFSQTQVLAGLHDYDRLCAACHGGPGLARADWASGINPTPPYLLDSARRWSPSELYWIVSNGVKMTAMPAWGEVEPKSEIWELVAFLEALPTLSASEYAKLRDLEKPAAPAVRMH